jgi:ribonuclease HII
LVKTLDTSLAEVLDPSEDQSLEDLNLAPFDWQALGPGPIIGVDEVGRGCLAGSVYAAAVIIPEGFAVEGITDSKLISEKRRKELAEQIKAQAQVSIAFANVEEIIEHNILQASFLAMRRAIRGLGVESGHVIVDGHMKIAWLSRKFKQTPLIKGDLRALPVGAASIVAKVTRDKKMKSLAKRYPGYGFEKHKGYASQEHRDAIQKLGPCRLHRRTFAGVREFLPNQGS